jgi:hypothetical protein
MSNLILIKYIVAFYVQRKRNSATADSTVLVYQMPYLAMYHVAKSTIGKSKCNQAEHSRKNFFIL